MGDPVLSKTDESTIVPDLFLAGPQVGQIAPFQYLTILLTCIHACKVATREISQIV